MPEPQSRRYEANSKKSMETTNPEQYTQLEKGGKMVAQHSEVMEIFADHYSKVLRASQEK